MIKCTECEHFKILVKPLAENYGAGLAKCKKYNLYADWFTKHTLNNLVCVEEEKYEIMKEFARGIKEGIESRMKKEEDNND